MDYETVKQALLRIRPQPTEREIRDVARALGVTERATLEFATGSILAETLGGAWLILPSRPDATSVRTIFGGENPYPDHTENGILLTYRELSSLRDAITEALCDAE